MGNYQAYLDAFKQNQNHLALTQIQRGIEKEGLRSDLQGFIAQTDHPSGLGSSLTHPNITTDYSEALLEFITPVMKSGVETLAYLEILHRFSYQHLQNEVIWPSSMPTQLEGDESVRIAEYGDSHIGQLKHIYRHGLWHRYGRVMQSIAGIHYNFSFSDDFWSVISQHDQIQDDQDFRSNKYLALIRNFRRYSWVLLYLFGASPAVSRSFVEGLPNAQHQLQAHGRDTLIAPYATSLRMSDLGYQNNAQSSLSVCYNTLDRYISTLGKAVSLPYEPYQALGVKNSENVYQQLNTNLLQIENEYYSDIRPKRITEAGEMPLDALFERGIEYIEVRCTDLNPYLPLGIDLQQTLFMDVFLTWCALKDSPDITDEECQMISANLEKVINEGRRPGLELSLENGTRPLQECLFDVLGDMEPLAELFDLAHGHKLHKDAIGPQILKAADASFTPSARIIHDLQTSNQDFNQFTLDLALKHRKQLSQPLANDVKEYWIRKSAQSIEEEMEQRATSSGSLDDFIRQYFVRRHPIQ